MSDSKIPNATIISGRFGPGNRAAAGRQSRGQKLRSAIMASISRDDVESITRVLIEQAIGGDQGAAKILLGFIGRPTDGPAVAIQVNASGRESGHVPSIAEHPPEPVTAEDLETMRASLMGRIGQARDAAG